MICAVIFLGATIFLEKPYYDISGLMALSCAVSGTILLRIRKFLENRESRIIEEKSQFIEGADFAANLIESQPIMSDFHKGMERYEKLMAEKIRKKARYEVSI